MKTFSLPEHSVQNTETGFRSNLFEDRFHSDHGAREEVEHVFIDANNLEQRWKDSSDFIIGELGFGLGASFLRTMYKWSAIKRQSSDMLHYFSIEGYPLSKTLLKEYHEKIFKLSVEYPEANLAADLIAAYPLLTRGTHRIVFEKHNVILTLAFMSVEEALNEHDFKANAWFLDGFSPSKNPEMWSESVFRKINQNTVEGGTFSTYSASASVKKNATAAQFETSLIKGFGAKREMLTGRKIFNSCNSSLRSKRKSRIAIIGGGLAGAAVFNSFDNRKIEAHLFEREADLSCGASANISAVIMPHLSSVPDYLCRYFLAGYLHTLRVLEMLQRTEAFESYSQSGVVRMANVNKWSTICSRIHQLGLNEIAQLIQGDELNLFLGSTSSPKSEISALLFPNGGSIRPAELVKRLTRNISDARLHLETEVLSIESNKSAAKVTLNNGNSLEFDYIIFTNAYDASFLNDISWLPIEKIKGQLFVTEVDRTLMPKAPLCYDGYAIPLPESKLLIGATYEHNAHEKEFNRAVVEDLSTRLRAYQPELPKEIIPLDGRACFRTTSPDRMPIIGMIPRRDGSETRYYSSLGHGSRGTISCLLAAEILASQILEEPSPIEADLLSQLAPERFLEREKRRSTSLENMYPASYLWREQNESSFK